MVEPARSSIGRRAELMADLGIESAPKASQEDTSNFKSDEPSRRDFLKTTAGALVSGALIKDIFKPREANGAEALALPASPTSSLTFNQFKSIDQSQLEKITSLPEIISLAYKNGFLSDEAVNHRNSEARKQLMKALSSLKDEDSRVRALKDLVVSLSNLVQDKVITQEQARDMIMKHSHAAAFIAIKLDGRMTNEGSKIIELDRAKVNHYYRELLKIEDVPQGNELIKKLRTELQQYTVAKN